MGQRRPDKMVILCWDFDVQKITGYDHHASLWHYCQYTYSSAGPG